MLLQGVIRSCKLKKVRQYNDLQNATHKTKVWWATQTPLTTGCYGRVAVLAPVLAPVMLLLWQASHEWGNDRIVITIDWLIIESSSSAMLRTRTSSIIYKNFVDMREGMGQRPFTEVISCSLKGAPLSARKRNQKLRNIRLYRAFNTGSDVSHVTPKGFPWVGACATRSWVSRPFFWCFRICCVVLHVRVLFFSFFCFFFLFF
jgi:hypothetical protein